MTIAEKYRKYLRYEKNYSSHTEISYYTDLLQFQLYLEQAGLDVGLIQADSDVVRGWVVSLMDQKLSATSVNRKLSSLKSFYRFLQKIGEIKKTPLNNVKGPKTKKAIPSFVNYSDIKDILDDETNTEFSAVRNRIIVELFYMTGIRREELIGLNDLDVDLDKGEIRVLGKRNKERIVPISDKTVRLLSSYLLVRNKSVEKYSDSFFVKEDGGSLYPMLVYRVVHSSLSWIPTLKKASPHILRHSFATSMLNGSAGINSVKEILGHESLASTEIYTHTSFEELKKIYTKTHPRG